MNAPRVRWQAPVVPDQDGEVTGCAPPVLGPEEGRPVRLADGATASAHGRRG